MPTPASGSVFYSLKIKLEWGGGSAGFKDLITMKGKKKTFCIVTRKKKGKQSRMWVILKFIAMKL